MEYMTDPKPAGIEHEPRIVDEVVVLILIGRYWIAQ